MNIPPIIRNLIQSPSSFLGLHVTAGSARFLVLKETGNGFHILLMEKVDFRNEGLLDEADFASHLKDWLQEYGVSDAEIVLGVSQEVSNIQVMDFPPNSQATLASMVAYQTGQLAELSEDSFIHHYQIMPADEKRPCPVLVGVCLKGVIDERLHQYESNGIQLTDLGMESTGLANSCCALYPEVLEAEHPQLILDIEEDGSTVVILWQGRMLYAGWLTCGSGNYIQACADRDGVPVEKIETNREDLDVTRRRTPDDPVDAVNQLLLNELHANIEQWREQEEVDAEEASIGSIYVSGEGAELAGLTSMLGAAFQCPCQLLGMQDSEGQVLPAFTVAYGLALQRLEAAPFQISLAPPSLKALARRNKRLPILTAATGLLGLLLVMFSLWNFARFQEKTQIYQKQLSELEQCEAEVTDLENVVTDVKKLQEVQLPVLEHGNRALLFAATIDQLSAARGENDWFVYIGGDKRSISEHSAENDNRRRTDSSQNNKADGKSESGLI
ncbi:MAG: hypothetical protein ACOCZS_02920, partial [Verrucomicrobiota bacterium]